MMSKVARATVLLSLLCLISPAAAEQNGGESRQARTKPGHIFTNDDIEGSAAHSDDGLPPVPGLVKCGKDIKCFLEALDRATPAALTRTETAREGSAVVTSTSTWWTTEFTAEKCKVSLRVDAIDAKVNERVVPQHPKAIRDAVEAKIAEMQRDFESIRGKTSTCSLAVKDFKTLMTSASWSLMSLGPASNFGKNCSGPAFDAPDGALSGEKK
jgi:hypothetical protein